MEAATALLSGSQVKVAEGLISNCCTTTPTGLVSVAYWGLDGMAGHNDSSGDGFTTLEAEREPPPAVVVINTISIIFGVLSILLNIIYLIATRFLKESGTAYNRFMINLSVSDVMSSLTFLVIHNWPHGPFASIDFEDDFYLVHALPYVFRSAPWMFLTSYLLTLTCLTVNQYVAVCRPWRYSVLVTARSIKIALLFVWLLSSLQVVIPVVVLLVLNGLSDKKEAISRLIVVSTVEMQVWMALYASLSVFNIVLNLIVYRRIRMLKLKRRGSHVSNPEIANIRMKQEAFVTVTLLLMACFFCRLPFPLMGIVGITLVAEKIDLNSYITINAGIVLLLYLNCFADPIIYILRTKELRRSCGGMMGRFCPRSELLSRTQSIPLTSTHYDNIQHNGTFVETESCIQTEVPLDAVAL